MFSGVSMRKNEEVRFRIDRSRAGHPLAFAPLIFVDGLCVCRLSRLLREIEEVPKSCFAAQRKQKYLSVKNTDKGKPLERVGRKAMGPKATKAMAARLPVFCYTQLRGERNNGKEY